MKERKRTYAYPVIYNEYELANQRRAAELKRLADARFPDLRKGFDDLLDAHKKPKLKRVRKPKKKAEGPTAYALARPSRGGARAEGFYRRGLDSPPQPKRRKMSNEAAPAKEPPKSNEQAWTGALFQVSTTFRLILLLPIACATGYFVLALELPSHPIGVRLAGMLPAQGVARQLMCQQARWCASNVNQGNVK